jgi:hypothetical protein
VVRDFPLALVFSAPPSAFANNVSHRIPAACRETVSGRDLSFAITRLTRGAWLSCPGQPLPRMKKPTSAKSVAFAFALVASAGLMLQARASFVIDSLDGDVTSNETSNFLSTVTSFSVATNNYGNAMADHSSGVNVEGIRRMYEATHNTALLDQYIRFCDVFLSHRNDLPGGEHRVMWDGAVDPIWPSVLATDPYPGYVGCESGQVAGHIAYCAWLILDNNAIWNNTVPDGNPNGYGATYKQRAQTYLTYVDDTLGSYFTKWFVNATTHRIQKPQDSRWSTNAGNSSCTAWNRQMMFVLPYDFSARCHDILQDNPSFLALYKDIVNQFATWFVAAYPNGGGEYYTSSNGHNVVKWNYEIPTDQHIENIGHAQHDVVGLFESYESQYTAVTSAQVKVYADATQYVINLGATNSWAGNVDGTGTAGSSLKTDFIFLSQWNRALYKMIAQSNIDANQLSGSEGCKNTGYILYMKHWMYTHNFSGNYKVIVRHSGGDLNVSGASTADGAAIVQWTYAGGTNEKWQLVDLGGSYYWFKNVNSGKAAVVQSASTANGAAVVQWTFGGSNTNDEWRLDDLGGGYYRFVNHNSGKVMDVSGGSTANGAIIDQWRWVQALQEQFQIISVP